MDSWLSTPREVDVDARTLAGTPDVETLLGELGDQPDPVALESTEIGGDYGRFSLYACRPVETLAARDARLVDGRGHVLAGDDESFWHALDRALSALRARTVGLAPGYLPGWVGYVGYEVGRRVERLPGVARRDLDLPDLRLALYDAILLNDGLVGRWQLVRLRPPLGPTPWNDTHAADALAEAFASACRACARPDGAPSGKSASAPSSPAPTPPAAFTPNFSPDAYRQTVARAIDYIAAGDIFQVNLSQRLRVDAPPGDLAVYRSLRRRNPSSHAAWLAIDDRGERWSLACSSPELFLRLRRGEAITRPIKGTRPRRGERDADRNAARELLASAKDNAELAMIVDLLRNDLGRICLPGTVRVVEPRRLETHPTVFHLVATIAGRPAAWAGLGALLRATFPGGSITGAPKIRAMEIIDELEPVARGPYTGCIGHVGVDGSCEWNIVIRTVLCRRGAASVQVGGGIVADSDPQAELDETLAKARAQLEAIAEASGTVENRRAGATGPCLNAPKRSPGPPRP